MLNDLRTLARNDQANKKVVLDRILRNLKTKGSLSYCRKKTNEFINKSIADIQPLKDTDFKFYLFQMVKSLEPDEEARQKPKDEKP